MKVLMYPLLAALVLTLTGCALPKGLLANRVSCTLAGDELIVTSLYGPLGVSSKVDQADLDALLAAGACKKPPTRDSGVPK